MSQLTKPVKFSAAALAACLFLSACGGGDATPPPLAGAAPSPAPAPAPAPTPTPPPPAPAPTPTGTALATFDETTALANGVFGGATVLVEAGPPGGSGNALKITRPGGEAFAGAFVITAPIAFSATRKTITARVYSPAAGVPMVAKAEFAENQGTGETSPTAAVVAGWQTLTWVFNNVDVTKSYTVFVLLPNLGTVGTGQSYYIDDITLAPEVAAPPPAPVGVDTVITTFDETAPPPVTEFGGAGWAIETGPTGGSGKSLKITRPGGDVFAGAWVAATPPIPFSSTRKTITARVYSATAGVPMPAKAEYAENAGTGDTAPTTAVVAGWQTLTWVFNNVDLSKSYTRFTILPNLGTVGTGQSYFFDDITLLAGAAEAPPPAPITLATLDEPTAGVVGFEGCWDSTLVPDPANPTGTNKVGRVLKPGTGVPFYCGTTIVSVANGGLERIAFTGSATTMTVRVWSPDVNIPVRLKVEDIADTTKSVETEARTTAVGWQTLTFDFANAASGTPVLNLATTYNKATIFFDFGSQGTGKTYYFDDVTFVTGTGTDTVLVTFDEKNFNNTQSQPSVLTDFGGTASSLVGVSDGLPADGAKTGKAAKVVKNAGETYAGSSVQRKPNDAVPTIPFTTGATKMSVRVYSAYAGMRVHMKVEQSGRPDINSEVDAFTTLVNTWETLTFDFGPAGKHFVPSGPGPNDYYDNPALPSYQATANLDVTKVHNKVNIFFDYGLGLAGYDAMPGTRIYYFDDVKFVGP